MIIWRLKGDCLTEIHKLKDVEMLEDWQAEREATAKDWIYMCYYKFDQVYFFFFLLLCKLANWGIIKNIVFRRHVVSHKIQKCNFVLSMFLVIICLHAINMH